ncbi:MAG: cache domain-containing protein [Acidobacteriota bacterium]
MKGDGPNVNLRILLTILILANVPLWIVAFITVDQAHSAFQNKIAADFRAIVKKNAVTVTYAVKHLVQEVQSIAVSPVIQAVVTNQNSQYPPSSQAIQDRIQSVEKIWLTPQSQSLVQGILSNSASKYLSEFVRVNHAFKRVTITDRFGAVAAANVKTVDYDQADESWWRDTFKNGIEGSVVIEDVTVDPVAKVSALHIAVPIYNTDRNLVIGTIGAILDVSDLLPLVSAVKIESTGDTLLVKDDGTIISASQVGLQQQAKLPYFDDIRDAMSSSTKRDFIVASVPGGNRVFVAYTSTGLAPEYPELRWIAVVAQDVSEAEAAIDTMVRNLLWAVMVVLVVIIVLALYLSTHRRIQFTDIQEVEVA